MFAVTNRAFLRMTIQQTSSLPLSKKQKKFLSYPSPSKQCRIFIHIVAVLIYWRDLMTLFIKIIVIFFIIICIWIEKDFEDLVEMMFFTVHCHWCLNLNEPGENFMQIYYFFVLKLTIEVYSENRCVRCGNQLRVKRLQIILRTSN